MPQMSPIDWLILSMFFLLIYFLSFMLIYFLLNLIINNNMKLKKLNLKNFILNW